MAKTSKRQNGIISVLLGLALALFAVPCTPAYAAGPEPCTLCINYMDGETPVTDAEFRVYKAAELLDHGEYRLTDSFAGCDVLLTTDMTNEDWMHVTDALSGWAGENKVTPNLDGHTGQDGKLSFTELDSGLYLVEGSPKTLDSTIYTAQSFCAVVPGLDADYNPIYEVTVEPKFETAPVPTPEPTQKPNAGSSSDATSVPGTTPPARTEDRFPYIMLGILFIVSLCGMVCSAVVFVKQTRRMKAQHKAAEKPESKAESEAEKSN